MVRALKMLINGVMEFMKRNTKIGGMNPTPQNNTNTKRINQVIYFAINKSSQ